MPQGPERVLLKEMGKLLCKSGLGVEGNIKKGGTD